MRWFGLAILMILIGVSPVAGQQATDPFGSAPSTADPIAVQPSPVQITKKPVSHATSVSHSDSAISSAPGDPFGPGGALIPSPVDVQWLSPTGETDQAIRQKMSQETKIQFINTPMPEVIGYLKQLHSLQFAITPKLQTELETKDNFTVSVNVEDLRLDSALDFLTESYDLGWYVEGGIVVITTANEADHRMSARIYFLKGVEQSNLMETIQSTLEPTTWEINGGEGRISLLSKGKLVVWQNRRGHERIEALVTTLNKKTDAK